MIYLVVALILFNEVMYWILRSRWKKLERTYKQDIAILQAKLEKETNK